MFISFDGVDGAGKSTQIELCRQWLETLGHAVLVCRDPGSTALGEKLRTIVLDDRETPIHRRAEMLLYMAARAQLVEEVIRPALAAGRTVISDRYLLANVVYQGWAGGMDPKAIKQIGSIAVDQLTPDRTLVLDLDPQIAAGRFQRELDRMESQGLEFAQRVRNGFLSEAEQDESLCVIDASGAIAEVHAAVQDALQPLLRATSE